MEESLNLFVQTNGLLILKTVCLLILAILFLQSGIDKLTDYKGNLEWLKGHFSKSFLRNMVPFMVMSITILELASGILALIGIPHLIITGELYLAKMAVLISLFSLTCLFFGQRIAKDYPGAASLIGYIAFTVISFFIIMQ